MSDESRERLYLPEFELEVPGTKLKNKCPAFFLADRRAASGAPSGKGEAVGVRMGHGSLESLCWWSSSKRPLVLHHLTAFFCAGQTYPHR